MLFTHFGHGMKKIKGSVIHYDQPFEPIGVEDWEAMLLEGLTPDTVHADLLAIPTSKELNEDHDHKR